MGFSRAGTARPGSRRRRWAAPVAVALALAFVAGACGKPEFRYVSNSSLNTYLKVPNGWKMYTQDELIGAEIDAARQANQPPSLIDTLVNRQYEWRQAFDSDPIPSVDHTLTLATDPVVEVSVRVLDPTEHDQVSLAALRNVVVNYDEMKQQAADNLAAQSVGIAGTTSDNFRPIDEQELNLPGGVHGVRLRFVLRPDSSTPFYAFDQTALVDAKSQYLYVLLIRSGEEEFIRDNGLFTTIAKSFTVKTKG